MLFGPRMAQQIPASELTFNLSSTWGGFPASNCFDGDNSTTCHADGADTSSVRLTIDYPCSRDLQRVVVVNRPGGVVARLNGFLMLVKAANGSTTFRYPFGGSKDVYDIQIVPFKPNPSW
jgi:hypothetical protein